MKVLGIIITLVVIAMVVFTAANWTVLTAPTPLSFVVFSIQGPLGVILLGIMLGLILLVVTYALFLRTTWLVESRRLNRQLEEQRGLTQQAETSRINALQDLIKSEFNDLKDKVSKAGESAIIRTAEAEEAVLKSIEETANGISATLGYIDDKLKSGT